MQTIFLNEYLSHYPQLVLSNGIFSWNDKELINTLKTKWWAIIDTYLSMQKKAYY